MSLNSAQGQSASISFRQLKLYESIGRLRSVRRASEDCNLSQPAVTQSLAKLERLVGATLVDRRTSGSYLNEQGELFYRRVDRFFAQFADALEQLGVAGGTAGVVSTIARLLRSQIRCLTAIVDHGSLAGAALALQISEASVQRTARDLESNVRRPLFYRTAAGTSLTPDGIEFGRRMKLCLQEIDWGIRDVETSLGEYSTPLIIGAMPFGGTLLLASVLEEFVRSNARTEVCIVNDSAADMLRRLRMGDVDFVVGLVPQVSDPLLSSVAFARTPYAVVARGGHPLASRRNLSLDDLAQCGWIVGAPGSTRRACFERLFENRECAQVPIATSARTVVRHLLDRSDRLTLMTSYEMQYEGDSLISLPVEDLTPVPEMGVTTRANWLPTALHTRFIQLIRDHMVAASAFPAPAMPQRAAKLATA